MAMAMAASSSSSRDFLTVLLLLMLAVATAGARPTTTAATAGLAERLHTGEGSQQQCWGVLMDIRSCTGEIILFLLNGEAYLGPGCCRAIRAIERRCWAADAMLSVIGFTPDEGDMLKGYCDAGGDDDDDGDQGHHRHVGGSQPAPAAPPPRAYHPAAALDGVAMTPTSAAAVAAGRKGLGAAAVRHPLDGQRALGLPTSTSTST